MFYSVGFFRTSSLGNKYLKKPGDHCSEEAGGGARLYRSLQQRAGSLNIKIFLLIIIIKKRERFHHLTCLLRKLYADQKVTEPDKEQKTGSKLGKEYIKAAYLI